MQERPATPEWQMVGGASGGRGLRFVAADRMHAERALRHRIVTTTTARLRKCAAARTLQRAWRAVALARATLVQRRVQARVVRAAAYAKVAVSTSLAVSCARPGRRIGGRSDCDTDEQVLDVAMALASQQWHTFDVLLTPAGSALRRL